MERLLGQHPLNMLGIKRVFLGMDQASADQERHLENKDFSITLDGSFRCQPLGGNSTWHSIDEAFVNAEIVDPEGGFREGAVHALKAAAMAHGQWPSHLSVERPNSKKVKRISASCSGTQPTRSGTPTPTSSLQEEGGAAALEGAAEEEGSADSGDGAAAAAAAAAGAPDELQWPAENSRRVIRGGRNSKRWVHCGAEWYCCFSCTMMSNGCPARLIVMRMLEGSPGRNELRIVFKHDCLHSADSTTHGQLRGRDRANAVASMDARNPAWVQALASEGRSKEHQLNNNVSTCGASSDVMRTAASQARQAVARRDPDLLVSMLKRAAEAAVADLAATPDSEKGDRCWAGDVPYLTQLSGGNFTMLLMTDHQLRLWAFCCQKRLNGLYVDATEGMVRLIE